MRPFASPQEALASIPDWGHRAASIESLPGGLNNRCYRVSTRTQRYVLRIAKVTVPVGGRDFGIEQVIHGNAAEAGLAPAIVYADPSRGLLLCDYLPGGVWQHRDLQEQGKLQAVARLLKRVHALPRCSHRFPALKAAQYYFDILRSRDLHGDTAAWLLEIVRTHEPGRDVVCCHNDIVAANIVGDDNPRLIDWEYARDNDPMFDLASLIGWHDLDERCADVLLRAYADVRIDEMRERLARQRRTFDAIQWLWLATRNPEDSRLELIRRRLILTL